MDRVSLGRKLAARRRDHGLTQAEVASRMGSTQAVVSRLESGHTDPSIGLLDRYARALGTVIELTVGDVPALAAAEERRRRVDRVLGERAFDPWARDPGAPERDPLLADGIEP